MVGKQLRLRSQEKLGEAGSAMFVRWILTSEHFGVQRSTEHNVNLEGLIHALVLTVRDEPQSNKGPAKIQNGTERATRSICAPLKSSRHFDHQS